MTFFTSLISHIFFMYLKQNSTKHDINEFVLEGTKYSNDINRMMSNI